MSIFYFYTATISFFAGVFIATIFSLTLPVITWLVFVGFISIILWRRFEEKKWLFLGLLLIFFSIGALRLEVINWNFGNSVLEEEVGKTITLKGFVASEPINRESTTQLEVQTEKDLLLVSIDKYTDINYGDEVEVRGKLARPESFETDLGRTFNYPGYLKAKGIEYKVSFAAIEVLERGSGNAVISTLLNFKHAFMQKIEASISEPAAGLGEGLLLGVKQALGEDLEAAFRKTGIIHIVVLSGYNIMLVVIFVMYILGYFLGPKLKMFFGIVAITSFALLVGLSATVVRASIMAALLLVTQVSKRNYIALRGLMLAGLGMLLINPLLLVYDVGFQLSFIATLGLILISPHLETLFYKIPNFLNTRSFIVATISTQLAVLPILLYQIGEFSLVAVIVNVLVLPMVPVAMLLTFITGLTGFISAELATFFALPTYLSLTYITEVAWWFSQLSFASYIVPAFSFSVVVVSYLLLGVVLWQLSLREARNKLVSVRATKTINDISEWVIEEEFDDELGVPRKKVGAESRSDSAPTDTPIFFR